MSLTNELKQELLDDFTHEELIEIYREVFELPEDVIPKAMSHQLIEEIDEDFTKNNPFEPDDCSQLLADYMIAAEYIKEDEEVEEVDKTPRLALYNGILSPERITFVLAEMHREYPEYAKIVQLPPCYTYHGENDPGCASCPVWDGCMEDRIKVRSNMKCFGVSFQLSNEMCKSCYEKYFCEQELLKGQSL